MFSFNKNKGLYKGLTIADYLIEKSLSDGPRISNMSVLKMIFFAQGFGYSDLNLKLIKDDFYAWHWGPVEINTYQTFKKYGSNKIIETSGKTERELKRLKEESREIKDFLNKVFELRNLHPFELSKLTHMYDSPWSRTKIFDKIDNELIRIYFKGMYC